MIPDHNVIIAIQAFQNGDLQNALASLDKALIKNSNNFDALLMMGVIHGITGNFIKALNCLEKATAVDPKNNFAHFNLAKVYSDLGNDLAAIKHHEAATALAPRHPEAWLNYGRSLFRLGNFPSAIDCFKKSIEINPQYAEAIASLASAHIALGESEKGLQLFNQAISLNPSIPGAWLMKGDGLHDLKRFEEALSHYDHAIKLKPDYAEAWSNKGITLHDLKRFEEALSHYDHAIKLKPDYAEAWSNKGITLHDLKRFEEALSHYDHAIKLKPDYAEAWSNKGITLHDLKRFEEALSHYDHAIKLKPDYAEAWSNKGITLHDLKRFEEALSHYDHAIKLKPDYAEAWSNKGITLHDLKRFEEALSHYDHAIKLKPDYAEAWSNKGMSLVLLNPNEAIKCLKQSIALNPNYSDAYSNLGLAYTHNKNYDLALKNLDIAILQQPKHAKAWANKGMTLNEINKLSDALNCFETAHKIDSELNFLLGNIINNKLFLADWAGIAPLQEQLLSKIENKKAVCAPFQILSLTDNGSIQRANAELWAKETLKPRKLAPSKPRRPKKLRLGYFSSDFKTHPVGILLAGVIQLHDREKYDVLGFYAGDVNETDPYTMAYKKRFDGFYNIKHLTDKEIAKLSSEMNIDIAIDLGGYTKGSVTSAFSLNLAPIQINYLGFMGTMGANIHDYIIADKTLIPKSHQQFFTEKIAYLPNTFMPDDDERKISSRVFNRTDFKLPNDAFVFACFNNAYKLNPNQLNLWANILIEVPHGILWLSNSNNIFKENLVREFNARGIHSSRIIFADHMNNLEDHLARLSLADLFLDTFPYNAHATAVDALRSGLPLLTRAGNSIASRVGASLLSSLNLEELITYAESDYLSKAVELARNPNYLKRFKEGLLSNLVSGETFKTQIYTRNLEACFEKIFENSFTAFPKDNVEV